MIRVDLILHTYIHTYLASLSVVSGSVYEWLLRTGQLTYTSHQRGLYATHSKSTRDGVSE